MAHHLYLSPDLKTAQLHAARAVAAVRQAHPFAPVSLLLPDRGAVEAARKHLGNSIGVRFYQFYSLGQWILDAAGLPIVRISEIAARRLVRQILEEMHQAGSLTTFAPVRSMPGFHQVLQEWLHEMKSQGIPPETWQEHANASGYERDRQLAEVYLRYQAFLRQNTCSDADGLLWLAAEALENNPALAAGQQLFLALGFDQFNPLQVRILSALANRCVDFTIYLPWDTNRPSSSLALSRLRLTRQRLEQALALEMEPLPSQSAADPFLQYIHSSVFENAASISQPAPSVSSSAVHLVAAPSREAEVRWAIKAVKRLMLDGTPSDEIILLAANRGAYQRIVEVVAAEYGVPVQVESSLRDNPAISALRNLLQLAPEFPWRETMDALRSPYINQPWLTAEQINLLDQLSRERPVLGRRDQWRFALQPIRTPEGLEAAEDEDLGPPRLASLLTPDELAAIENGLLLFFDHLTPPTQASYRAYSFWLQQAVLGLLPDLEEAQDSETAPEPPPGLGLAQRCQDSRFAQRDLQAVLQVVSALRNLVDAAELVAQPGDPLPSWHSYRADLLDILSGLELVTQPQPVGVHFDALEAGRSRMVDHLFVLGLAEGEFPRLPPPDVLFAPAERTNHPLPLIRQEAGEQASLWWQVIGNSRRSLTLLRPRLDEKGAPWLPSSYWDAVVEAARRVMPELRELELPIAAQPSLDQSASPPELLLALVNNQANAVPPPLHQSWQASLAAAEIMRQRQGWQPAPPYEGVLSRPEVIAEIDRRYGPNHNWSASRLNNYGKCPYSFFAQNILSLEERADPREGFDAMQRGTLLHAILEALFLKLTEEAVDIVPANLPHIQECLDEACARAFQHAPDRYGFQPGVLWRYEQDELRRLLRVLIASECDQNGQTASFRPYRQEVRFGIQGGDLPSLRVESSDGTAFYLHGVIDRLDCDENQRLRLIDYKSGSATYSKPDILKGLAFQSALYARAAEQLIAGAQVAESYYLHIPRREKSGHLKFQQGVAADSTVQEAVERAAAFVTSIRRGVFPTLPAKPGIGQGTCASCPYGHLCRVDRRSIAKARRGGIS